MKKLKRRDEDFRVEMSALHGDLMFADDHDNAILGVVSRCGQEPFLVYDRAKLIRNYMKDGMTHEEAEEWIDFNWNAWLGPATPAILEPIELE